MKVRTHHEVQNTKMPFSLLFFGHQYLAYYNRLTSEVFKINSKLSYLVNSVSDPFYIQPGFHFMKEENKMKK